MYGVWYMVYDVWCMVYDVWCKWWKLKASAPIGDVHSSYYDQENVVV